MRTRLPAALLALLLSFGVVACDDDGDVEEGTEQLEEGVEDAGDAVDEGAEEMEEEAEE